VVCIDMFQTLVDVNSRRHLFWHEVLQEKYSERLAEEYSASWVELFNERFNDAARLSSGFATVKSIAAICFDKVFTKTGLTFDSEHAAQMWIDEHKLAPPYDDTKVFLQSVSAYFPVCLVSDADDEMIWPHLEKYQFDMVFISERFKAYKNTPDGKLFRAVINHYQTVPQKVIHIGDGYNDIGGANRVGITACWLNRDRRKWNHNVKPNHEVASLIEAASLLGIQVNNIIRDD